MTANMTNFIQKLTEKKLNNNKNDEGSYQGINAKNKIWKYVGSHAL